jgi:hypothetical protein
MGRGKSEIVGGKRRIIVEKREGEGTEGTYTG